MFTDPAEDIIKILYGPLEGEIYKIMKKEKTLVEPALKSKFDNINDIARLGSALDILEKDKFIEINTKDLPPDPKIARRPKWTNKVREIKFNEKFDFDTLHEKYKDLKSNLLEELTKKEEEKYFCKKCNEYWNENLAIREDHICPKCKQKFIKNEVDYFDLKIKCNNIFNVLDDRFKKKLDNANQENYSNNINYIKAKYGNNIFTNIKINTDNKSCIIEDENEPYISSTLKDLEKNNKEEEKLTFYELIESFNKFKKK